MRMLLVAAVVAAALSACASNRVSDSDRLALYLSHAGAPVKQVRYLPPMSWDRIDDQHVVLELRPNESWMLRLAGPCLSWSSGSPFLKVETLNGMTLTPFDKVTVPGSQISCQIREIRPLDVKAIRAGMNALRDGVKAQASGT
ncbi:MAG TPA: DUF6491 family protein [Thermomonas sp.]|uniref:DUF6491 family protein n=1 Tax=Thermomonas sp. TaxID=1971895 RepID=UPI002C8BC230|nr:DUF6491 family protein [Thermomonas sp.]HOV95446.1 DUF6491 family protein [Thermomonas sp.]